jgi:hypothetical protein
VTRAGQIVILAAFLASTDIPRPGASSLTKPASQPFPSFASSVALPSLIVQVSDHTPANAPLRPESRLEIVRYVAGEFGRIVRPLPAGKGGYRYDPRTHFDDATLKNWEASHGSTGEPGQTVQITRIDFREKELEIEINGGGKRHTNWRDHLQVGLSPGPATTSPTKPTGSAGASAPGATLVLAYGGPVPDMGPDDLKRDLSAFLDFSSEHSAATNWAETLPAPFKQAIQERRAIAGMNHDMVMAALGRPDQKVRERNDQDEETEDWIYGSPPEKTVFVTFIGDKVVRVREYP